MLDQVGGEPRPGEVRGGLHRTQRESLDAVAVHGEVRGLPLVEGVIDGLRVGERGEQLPQLGLSGVEGVLAPPQRVVAVEPHDPYLTRPRLHPSIIDGLDTQR